MMKSPSWAANWFTAGQEIPHISRSPKVHYRTHKRPPPVPILGQPNPVHIPTSHLLQIHPNIIHPSTPVSPQWSLSHQFPTKTLYTASVTLRLIWRGTGPLLRLCSCLLVLQPPPKDTIALSSQRLTTANNVLHCFGLHPTKSADWIPIKQTHSVQVPPYRSVHCVGCSYHF